MTAPSGGENERVTPQQASHRSSLIEEQQSIALPPVVDREDASDAITARLLHALELERHRAESSEAELALVSAESLATLAILGAERAEARKAREAAGQAVEDARAARARLAAAEAEVTALKKRIQGMKSRLADMAGRLRSIDGSFAGRVSRLFGAQAPGTVRKSRGKPGAPHST
jgi:hypothetical protein